jgi:hypothetical protein
MRRRRERTGDQDHPVALASHVVGSNAVRNGVEQGWGQKLFEMRGVAPGEASYWAIIAPLNRWLCPETTGSAHDRSCPVSGRFAVALTTVRPPGRYWRRGGRSTARLRVRRPSG